MKEVTIKAYRYDELSSDAQKNFLDYLGINAGPIRMRFSALTSAISILCDYKGNILSESPFWWVGGVCYDSRKFYLEIQEIDININYCKAKFMDDADKTAKAIINGANGKLLKIAEDWQKEVDGLFKSYSDYDKYKEWLKEMDYTLDDIKFEDWVIKETGYMDDKKSSANDFLYELEHYFLRAFIAEYDYYTDEGYIKDYLEEKDYWFDVNGKILDYGN